MSDITIGYKGNTIGTLDATGTKKLLTAGKYCVVHRIVRHNGHYFGVVT